MQKKRSIQITNSVKEDAVKIIQNDGRKLC